MSRYKSELDKQIEAARKKVWQMERGGLKNTAHHQELRRLLAIKPVKKKVKDLGETDVS